MKPSGLVVHNGRLCLYLDPAHVRACDLGEDVVLNRREIPSQVVNLETEHEMTWVKLSWSASVHLLVPLLYLQTSYTASTV